MEAKRKALESVVKQQAEIAGPAKSEQDCPPVPTAAQQVEGEYPQLSRAEGHRKAGTVGKSLKRLGSSGRIRTYNPSVNSRMLYR